MRGWGANPTKSLRFLSKIRALRWGGSCILCRMLRRLLAMILLALFVGLAFACGPLIPCVNAPCECDEGLCELDCRDLLDCTPTCNGADTCDAECPADGCDFLCEAGTNCKVDCGADCKVECSSTSTCGARCGPGCTYDCHNVNNCAPKLGDEGSARCESVGNCDVTCEGRCSVECVNVGNCNVNCAEGSATMCPDGRRVCGGSC